MLCVFFRHCVSGNPLNFFLGVFFFPFYLGFLCEGFFGTNFLNFRGKCCAFFSGAVFRGNPLNCFGVFFFRSTCLRFFVRRGFRDELSRRIGAGGVVIFCLENATVLLEKPRGKKFSFC